FNSCDEGVALARTLKDVAVQNPLRRSSADLGPTQRAVLDGTPLGPLTPAEIPLQGGETFAVCGKPGATGGSPGKRDVRAEISTQNSNDQSKPFLKELGRGALIEPAECRCPSR